MFELSIAILAAVGLLTFISNISFIINIGLILLTVLYILTDDKKKVIYCENYRYNLDIYNHILCGL